MPKFTVREFAKSVGLDVKGADYIGAGIMLKVLQNRGIAKEVDRINTSARGRKSVVYEVPNEFVLTLDDVVASATVNPTPVVETVTVVEDEQVVETVTVVEDEQVVETVTVVEDEQVVEEAVAVASEPKCYYGDDDDEDDLADAA